MSVTVECPECETPFHLQPDVLGRAMRCPECGEVFEAREASRNGRLAEPVEEPEELVWGETDEARGLVDTPRGSFESGTVADFVPIIDAEAEPREVVWSEEGEPQSAPEPAPEASEAYRPRKRKSKFAFLLLTAGSLGGIALIAILAWQMLSKGKAERWDLAKATYADRDFNDAVELADGLLADYPDDVSVSEWRFFRDFATLRAKVYSVTLSSDPLPAVESVNAFVREWADEPFLLGEDPRFDGYPADLWETSRKLTEVLADRAGDDLEKIASETDEAALGEKVAGVEQFLTAAEGLFPLMARYRPENFPPEEVRDTVARLRGDIADRRELLLVRDEILSLLAEPSDDNLRKAGNLLDLNPELKDFQSIKGAREQAVTRQSENWKYVEDALAAQAAPADAAPPGLLFVPRQDTGPPAATSLSTLEERTIFFAVARGILYALDEADGSVLWAARVGIDTEVLPLRVPASDANPELVLVTSNDGREFGITALLATTGQPVWHQPLDAPALGQPIRVDRRVFVPTADEAGTIHEIEITTGYRLGRIVSGKRLHGGGVYRETDGLAYFPAAARVIFVCDVDSTGSDANRLPPRLVGLLPTGHAEGTLLGGLVLIGPEVTGTGATHLILCEQAGLEAVSLKAYMLPIGGQVEQGWGPAADLQLAGWNWFTPYHDLERLAVVTDRGEFGLFGIKQAGTPDPILFPMPPEPLDVRMDESGRSLRERDSADSFAERTATRGQVVHAGEDRFWVLIDGSLHQLRLAFPHDKGLTLIRASEAPLPLGTPLHAGQVNARRDLAVAVTQSENGSACLATAVDLWTGEVRWQRQLGLIAAADPAVLGDQRILMDQNGGLYRIDDVPELRDTEERWLIDPRWRIAKPLTTISGVPQLLRMPDGESLLAVIPFGTERDHRVMLREVRDGRVDRESAVRLPHAPAGNAITLGGDVLLPLADGTIHRIPAGGGVSEPGPSWRGPRGRSGRGFLTRIGEDEFLSTDGSRTVTHRRWPAGGGFSLIGEASLRSRIVSPPVVLDDGRVILADGTGTARLLNPDRMNTAVRTWTVGEVTAGPFVRGDRVGVVVEGKDLVWLDPDADAPAWVHQSDSIVGEPAVSDGKVWLASESGRITALDAATGKPVGETVLPDGLAAASAPVKLGGERLLLPLSDGTVALPKVRR